MSRPFLKKRDIKKFSPPMSTNYIACVRELRVLLGSWIKNKEVEAKDLEFGFSCFVRGELQRIMCTIKDIENAVAGMPGKSIWSTEFVTYMDRKQTHTS